MAVLRDLSAFTWAGPLCQERAAPGLITSQPRTYLPQKQREKAAERLPVEPRGKMTTGPADM